MSQIYKKTINTFDGGIMTSTRDNQKSTSSGAQMIKHFDIYSDPHKLTPMPSWESFTTDLEKIYNIRAVGGYTDTVYGIGSAISNWYGSAWNYRVKVTPDTSLYTSQDLPLHLDLSDMPAGFWANTNSNGSDIRVTNESHEGVPFEVESFNQAGQTGSLWVTNAFTGFFYIYYGNATASAMANSGGFVNQTQNVWDDSNMRFAFTFPEDVKNRSIVAEEFLTEPTYVAGLFGKAITTSDIVLATDPDDEVALSSNDVTISFMIYLDSAPTSQTTIIEDNQGYFSIDVRTDRKLEIYFNGSAGNTVQTAASALSVGQWYVIDVAFNHDQYLYTNGVLKQFTVADGDYDGVAANTTLLVRTSNPIPNSSDFCKLAQIWGFNDDLTQAQVTQKYNNFTNASFWTIAAQEAKSSITLNYSGVQVYTKSISSGDWTEMLEANQPTKDLNKYPINGFVEVSGDVYFMVSTEADGSGFCWLAKTSSLLSLDAEHLLLTILSDSAKMRPRSDSPTDTQIYFTFGNSALGAIGDPGSSNEYAAGGTIMSHMPWRTYLGVGYTRRTRAMVELWDLILTNPIEKIDCGTGNLRVVGNASDILFSVVDNYIDDEVLSSGKPTMEIKKYVGNSRMESVVRMQIPANYTAWADDWERAISNFSFRRNTETLFYAKLPANSTATEWHQGFWAVGKNKDGQLALSLMIDTSEFDNPENVHGFAQQVFYVEKDGGIQRLSEETYDKISLYQTRLMNEGNTEIEKKLRGIEIVTEPLGPDQVISIYYKLGEDGTRVKIADFSGENAISFEAVTQADEENLPNYQEIDIQVESVGGPASILEINYQYEYLSDIV